MWQIIGSAIVILCGIAYYMTVGPALLPILLLLGGGMWALVACIRVATKT